MTLRLRGSLVALLALLLPALAAAQVVIVDSNITTTGSTGAPVTCSGSNRYLLVGLTIDTSTHVTTDTVSRDGQALTKIGEATGGTGQAISFWGLVAPNANTTAVTDTDDNHVVAVCLSGVDQATPADTANFVQTAGAASISSGAIASAVNDMVFSVMSANSNSTGQIAPSGGSQTEIEDLGGAGTHAAAMSWQPGAASVTASWTWASSRGTVGTININAAGGGGGGGCTGSRLAMGGAGC
jgi:hypothetical protein